MLPAIIMVAFIGLVILALYRAMQKKPQESDSEEMNETEEMHSHQCVKGHHWTHTGPTALNCQIPESSSDFGDETIYYPEDCAVCAEREELLLRGPHLHKCWSCDGEWTHEGLCIWMEGARCPWCDPESDSTPNLPLS